MPLSVLAEGDSSTGEGSSAPAEGAPAEGEGGGAPPTGGETPPQNSGALYQPPFEPQAAGVYVLSVDTGMAVYEKNAHQPLVAASLVKLMTCILVMETAERYGDDLDTTFVDSTEKAWVYDALYGKNASTADIRRGEVLSLRELLYATLLPSANEAALLLADYVSVGYMPNYLYMMHARAASLGCTGTTFADPNGLSEENYTTAHDMALIMQEFMKYPVLMEIASAPTYEMAQHEKHSAPYTIHTTNRLLVGSSPYYKSYSAVAQTILGGKTGSLGGWQNFASAASKGGETYICVVMNSPPEADTVGAQMDPVQSRPALVESAMLYDWVFSTLTVRPALDTEDPVCELKVKYSTDYDTVKLLPTSDVKAVLPVDAASVRLQKQYDLPEWVAAPVKEGQEMGTVTLSVGGQIIGTSTLIASRDIERNQTLYMVSKTGDVLTSTYVRVLAVIVVVAAIAYAGLVALAHWARTNKKRRRRPPPRGPGGTQPRRQPHRRQ